MNNSQLYFAIGVPSLMVLIGVLVNVFSMNQLGTQLGVRITSLENSINSRLSSLESRFEILTGKVADIDNRLSVFEDRLKR